MPPNSKDSFDEDEAEFQKLHEKPSCFIVIGKPGAGKTTLAKHLAHYWKCILVTPESVIEWAAQQQDGTGNEVRDRLLHGQALPESLALNILHLRISAHDIKHHGYVLDGIPTLDSEFITTEEQINIIKNFEMTPDFIINIKISDEDLIMRRTQQLLHPGTNTLHPLSSLEPGIVIEIDEEEEEEEEEEGEEDELDEDSEPDAIPENIYELIDPMLPPGGHDKMIRRPEDSQENVEKDIMQYTQSVLPSLEDYIIAHNRQYLIELNGLLDKRTLLNTLMNKLSTFCAYCAIQPISLFPEDEDQEQDIEAEDLLKMLVKKDTVGGRFPWRKSRWSANDPVALQHGSITQGKFQHSVSYLGKVYCMSSDDNMKKFLENPRPYLLPPQPRIPAKLCVIGPPSSGKSTLCKTLAEHYGAALLDMNELAAEVRETEQNKHIDQVREDAKVTFLNQIREQIQSAAQLVIESRARRAMLAAELAEEGVLMAEETAPTEDTEAEEAQAEQVNTDNEEIEKENNLIKKFSFTFDDENQIVLPEITESHPLVQEQVEKLTVEARNHEVEISPEMYGGVLEAAIRDVVNNHQMNGDPEFGGWILDNFPTTRDQWSWMTDRPDKLLTPDSFIILTDPAPENGSLLKRWAEMQSPPIVLTEAQIKSVEKKKAKPPSDGKTPNQDGLAPLEEEDPEDLTEQVPTSVEQRVFSRKAFDREKPQLEAIIKQSDVEFITIPCNVIFDDLKDKAIHQLDSSFRYKAIDYFSYEEEDEEEDEEDEGEEQVDKRNLGESRHFCPVTLLERNVLWPGDHEIGARYREKIYLFSNAENKTKFLENPEKYAPSSAPLTPPPIRLCILGPKAAGKTAQGRSLAKKLGVFHISFHKYLEEIIIPKVKVRAWESDHEEEVEASPEEEEDEEDEEQKEEKAAKELAMNTKEVDLDDTLLQTPSGMEHLVASFTSNTVEKFQRAVEVRRALMAKEKSRVVDPEEALSELEEGIHSSLVEGDSLPSEVLEQIVCPWWNDNPFKDTGFILEGFPRTPQEATFMTESGLFPDACLLLEVDDDDVASRQLPKKLFKWKLKMAKKLERRQRHMERRKLKREKEKKKKIQEKYDELVAERDMRLDDRRKEKEEAAKYGEVPDSEGEESDEEPEVILKDVVISDDEDEEEDDDLGEEEDETEEEAVDRIRGEISDRYDSDMSIVGQLQNTLEDLNIPRIEVDARRKPNVVFFTLQQQLRSIIDCRLSLFAQCLAVRAKQANQMLAKGYKQSSRFGRWDPVLLKDGCAIQPYQAPGRMTYPVVYRAHTYFMSTPDNRQKFIENPLSFLSLPSPPPVVPVKLAIVGPPKSGKSMLARRLERDHGIVCLSIGEAVRKFLAQFPTSGLAKEMESHLKAGVTLPDALAAEALEKIMLSQQCQTRGYVLDGYPNTIEQVELLTDLSIIPVQIIELTLPDKDVHWRGTADRHSVDRTLSLHDSSPILDVKLSCYKRQIDVVREHYSKQHRNWHVLDASRSKWWLSEQCTVLMNEQLKTAQLYLQKRDNGQAASIYNLCVTPKECDSRLGEFSHYCPVMLAKHHQLIDCSHDDTLLYTAEFRSRYYKMMGQEELDAFLADAQAFVAPTAPHSLSDDLPQYVSKTEVKRLFPKELSFRGYCPVTYITGGRRYEALIPGCADNVVQYKEELFSMTDDQTMETFLRQPWKFANIPLPAKLPPAKLVQDVASLPMLGYMEQTVSKAIITALTACSNFKPKYPYVDAHKSALLFVGYHLKAHNPKASQYSREKYRKKLETFQGHCELIKYLGNNMNRRYKTEEERPIDFNYKMEEFLALRSYPLPLR